MAEQFIGRNGQVIRFSNGAFETLFRAAASLASKLAQHADELAVQDFLEKLLQAPLGFRAFSVRSLPEELNSSVRLRFFADVIHALAMALRQEQRPPELHDAPWSRPQRMSWLARMIDLHDVLRDLLPEHSRPSPLAEKLDAVELAECKLERDELVLFSETKPVERLARLRQMLALAQGPPVLLDRLGSLWRRIGEEELGLGQDLLAIQAWEQALEVEPDSRNRDDLRDAIQAVHSLDGLPREEARGQS